MQLNPNDRHILVISGEQSESLKAAQKLVKNLEFTEVSNPKKAHTLLGQEFDAVIFPTHEGFDPNAFGAIVGTIREGGYLLLLKPETYPAESLFLKRFTQLVTDSDMVHFIDINAADSIELAIPIRKSFSDIYASQEQQKAVKAIIHVVKGHRRRPLVLTSDRGRGKSAALGIAAAELIKTGTEKIIVCAPSKHIATMVFQHAISTSAELDGSEKLLFFSPDELQRQKPKADLVMVDEAAAIPVPLLSRFLKHYSRIVFASTQHGYEGSGRGFAINFRKILDKETPNWSNCQLTTPIRWQEDDSLEKFSFEALLLDAEPADYSLVTDAKVTESKFTQVDKLELLHNNDLLTQIFGQLVSAHYQTKPSDLMHLLDDEQVAIYCLMHKSAVIAVSLVVREGGIKQTLVPDIFVGKRRIQGHLVAQSLSVNVGIEFASQLSGERIIRIAVHPDLQQQGFGKNLLNQLINTLESDYLSSSFGVTVPVLDFWQGAGFLPVYLGMKRDASSGTHSVIMLRGTTANGVQLQHQTSSIFSKSFPQLLSDPLKHLETDIALALLPQQVKLKQSPEDIRSLKAFAKYHRGYENSLYLIWDLVCQELPKNNSLKTTEKRILMLKVLQKRNWKKVVEIMELRGKKEALSLLRQAVAKLL